MFDLNLFPLHFEAGHEQPELPGLLAAAAHRRAERHRSGDILAALFAQTGPKTSAETSADWFQNLSDVYFASGGTVTAALKSALEKLNQHLIGKSVVSAGIAVVRNQWVYLVTCGAARAFLINPNGVQEFNDLSSGWPGLGASRTPNLRFFQAELLPGDLLLLCVDPPPAWTTESISGHNFPSPEVLRRRLLTLCSTDIQAGILQFQPGKGQVQRMRRNLDSHRAALSNPSVAAEKPAPPVTIPPAAIPPAATPPVNAAAAQAPAVPRVDPTPAATERPAPPVTTPAITPGAPAAATPAHAHLLDQAEPAPEDLAPRPENRAARARKQHAAPSQPAVKAGLFARLLKPKPARPAAETVVISSTPASEPQPSEPLRPPRKKWFKGLAALIRGTRAVQKSAGQGMGKVIPRVLPGRPAAQAASFSPATMVFISLVVPLIVAAAAVTVYYRQGASEERIAFLQQARIYAEQAGNQSDPALRRGSWEQTLYWVDKAEDYGEDDESQALRRRAQVALDSIDGVVRMSMVPAFSSTLGNQISVTGLAATSNDLYLLDSTAGRVLHMTLGGSSYEYDPDFNCGPGPSGSLIIGQLVGMVTLPPGNEANASVLAVDAAGNLLYCLPDEAPLAKPLEPPDNNWGKISGMTVSGGNLYIIDIESNSIFRYDGANFLFPGEARLFFGNEVPNLSNVIDMTIYQDDLYLLRGDGTVTLCTWSAFDFAPTRCSDPAPYGDARKATEINTFSGTRFIQLQTTQPPDPSLYILNSTGPSIYHFSLRLNLQRQLRQDADSDFPLPDKPVTAIAIASNRTVFLAFGNQVFYGALP